MTGPDSVAAVFAISKTSESTPVLRFDGVEITKLFIDALPTLVPRVLEKILEVLPTYGVLPSELISEDVVDAIRRSIVLFVDVVGDLRQPTEAELTDLKRSAARRAEGVPLEMMLAAYNIGTNFSFCEVVACRAQPDDIDELRTAVEFTLEYLRTVTAAITKAYVEEQVILGTEHALSHQLFRSLVDGHHDMNATRLTGAAIAPTYVILSLAFDPHTDEDTPGVDPIVAGHRKLRRLRRALEHETGSPLLGVLTPTGGVVLVPTESSPADIDAADWVGMRQIITAMAAAGEVRVIAGAVAAAPASIRDRMQLPNEILEIVADQRRPTGLYRIDDVAIDYQLRQPGPARDHLSGLLRSLDDNPRLLETLTAYLHTGLNRRQTALGLNIHPNTVDYRIHKITDLTGLDPSLATDHLLLVAALAAGKENSPTNAKCDSDRRRLSGNDL
jgi:hypothetical protein